MSGGGAFDANSAPLATLLGYAFADVGLLQAALTHPSAGEREARKTYERLEFLGDRVLALAIAELVVERFPHENEGALSRRLVGLVRAEAVAEVAERICLGAHLAVSASARKDGERAHISMLSDACEAVIGALYLDGGLAPARDFVRRHWADAVAASGKQPPLDAKTALQEWLQGRGFVLPEYRLVGQDGPSHAPEFTIEVRAEDGRAASAIGANKRAAEQAAAAALLQMLEGSP